jgi:hypothetical protein
MHLGLGCAIENLALAERACGMATDVQPVPGHLQLAPPPTPVVAARIGIAVGRPEQAPLFEAIPRRHMNRGPYRDDVPPSEQLRGLADPVSGPQVRVAFVEDPGARRELGALIIKAQMLGGSDEFGPALTTLVRAEHWEPTFVFRLGYATREAPRSPRRLLSEVLIR